MLQTHIFTKMFVTVHTHPQCQRPPPTTGVLVIYGRPQNKQVCLRIQTHDIQLLVGEGSLSATRCDRERKQTLNKRPGGSVGVSFAGDFRRYVAGLVIEVYLHKLFFAKVK